MTIQNLHFYVLIALFVCMQNMESTTVCEYRGFFFRLYVYSIWLKFSFLLINSLLILIFIVDSHLRPPIIFLA